MSEIKVPEVKQIEPFEGKIPAFWAVQPVEGNDNEIEASNSTTGEVFNGSIKEFNARLKG